MNEEQQHRQQLLLQDEEHYIRTNGIEDQSSEHYEFIGLQDERVRLEEEQSYQHDVFQKLFQSTTKTTTIADKRTKFLESCKKDTISIQTADEVLENIPLHTLAKTCEVIYTLVSSEHWSSSSVSSTTNETTTSPLKLSLEHFHTSAVRDFLLLVEHPDKLHDYVSSDNVIECCKIAHFLQCATLLTDIVEVIRESINADNCASICNLADQLDERSLFMSAMSYVLERLEDVQKDDVWTDFSPSLQNHIVTLRNATQSSIVQRGRQTSKTALFSSSHEFLALFSDHVYEQRERLREAVERQNDIIKERIRRNEDRSFFSQPQDVMGGSVGDAAIKIEKQEMRIQTLEVFYREQKAIFAKDVTAEGRYERPFVL